MLFYLHPFPLHRSSSSPFTCLPPSIYLLLPSYFSFRRRFFRRAGRQHWAAWPPMQTSACNRELAAFHRHHLAFSAAALPSPPLSSDPALRPVALLAVLLFLIEWRHDRDIDCRPPSALLCSANISALGMMEVSLIIHDVTEVRSLSCGLPFVPLHSPSCMHVMSSLSWVPLHCLQIAEVLDYLAAH